MADEETITDYSATDVVEEKDSAHLATQDANSLDLTQLHALSPEVISRQATINIGTIGHVAHGKSTVVKALSGVQTVKFQSELERNITIKLGYANAKIYKCSNPNCPRPSCYKSYGSSMEDDPPCEVEGCSSKMILLRHVSFVDCFGPEVVFATPTGTIRNADIMPGTELLGPDGHPRVVADGIADGVKPMYEVAYVSTAANSIESEAFTASGGHLLCLRIDMPVDTPVHDRTKNTYFVKHYVGNSFSITSTKVLFDTKQAADDYYAAADKSPVMFTMTIESYLNSPKSLRRKARMYRPGIMHFAAEEPPVNLRIGTASEVEVAWLVGLWLGDGDALNTRFTLSASGDNLIKERMGEVAAKMGLVMITHNYPTRDAVWINLTTASGPRAGTAVSNELSQNPFWHLLKGLGIANKKHVPQSLLTHSVEVRAAVVAGLIDSDGHYASGQFDLEQSEVQHAKLFHSFVRLVRTLGFVAHCSRRVKTVQGVAYPLLRVRFNGDASLLPIATPSKRGNDLQRSWATSVPFTVTPIGDAPYRKWQVDSDGQVLLQTFVVGHNCPGHDILMATMLNGAAVMDAALLLIAGNELCPQPQTSEHLAAIEIMKLQHILILQNKIDLVTKADAIEQEKTIRKFVQGTVGEKAPIVPISAQLGYNTDVLCEYIVKHIPIPVRDFSAEPRMIVIRSFDVNKPGRLIDELKGGVAGGTIFHGVLRVNDLIEIRPGNVTKDPTGKHTCQPIHSRIISLFAERNALQFAVPGGLIGCGTLIDPSYCRQDRLVGQVVGTPGRLPEVFSELEINFFLLRRLLGIKSDDKKASKVAKLQQDEVLMVNIGSTSTGGRVLAVKRDLAKISLLHPVCTMDGEKIALSRRVERHWRLIGWGKILRGVTVEITSPTANPSSSNQDDSSSSDDE